MDKNDDTTEVEESLDLPDIQEGEEDATDWKAEAQKLREKAISQRERTKALRQELKDAKKAVEVVATSRTESKPSTPGALDETQLDYLDLKGISDLDDIKLIERHTARTGDTVRQALKDDYVISKLEANKAAREVKAATPSSTRRSGSQTGDSLEVAIAKYEQAGYRPESLPTDFALRSAVINAIADKQNPNKPAWL